MRTYHGIWRESRTTLNWNCPFVTPGWLQTVVTHLGATGDPTILSVYRDKRLIGVVPLAICNQRAQFLGSSDVCDYQDIVSFPGEEKAVMHCLVDHLRQNGIKTLDLETIRPDASISKGITPLVASGTVEMIQNTVDVTFETPLPESWKDYLQNQLNGKQRHEVRRKVRRLEGGDPFVYRLAANGPGLQSDIATFLQLFQKNREDKADFMTAAMSAYFQDLMITLADLDQLRLYFLEIAKHPAAAVFCFDYDGVRYLYNSGYDARYHDLSVGILSKVFSISAGIEAGCRQYDFLKGAEAYKKRIGGQEVQLLRYRIDI
jgi:CelD/BcsL family acetyltransferase involved in cellulose biosynthesis